MSCQCLEIVYGPRPSVEFLCPVRKIEFFPIAKGVPGDPGPEGPEGPEGPPNTDASLLSTGTVPLGRLSGLTSAQLSATAGILSSQIAGLDASKITGTFPLSLLSQGTTGQFLRGDGTYSNTLTGGLTIAGALAGATTGAFSTSVTTPILNPSVVGGSVIVGGNLAWNASWVTDTSRNSIAQTTGGLLVINTPSANQLYIRQAGVDKVLLGDTSACYGTGGLAFVGASTTQFTTQAPSIGSRNAVTLNLNATGSVVLENGGTASLSASSTAVTLGSHSKIIYGAAGTTTAANSEIVGAVGGLRYNVASGLGHTLLVANTAALTLNSTSATFSGTLAATAATITTGSIQFLANNGGLLGSGSSNQMRIGSGSTGISSSGASIALNGNTTTTLQGYLWLYAGQVAGGRIRAIDETNAQQMEISSAGTTIKKIILTANTPATATSTGTAGQIAWDASGNLYLCPAANTWLKFTGATF